MSAARRAANSYAAASNTQLLYVGGETGNGRSGRFLLLARAELTSMMLSDCERLRRVSRTDPAAPRAATNGRSLRR